MHKILTVVVAALMSAAAFGELSWATVNTEAYGEDPSPSSAGTSAYKGYLCTVDAAKEGFKSGTVQGVTDYFVNHFAAGSETLEALSALGTSGAKLTGGATAFDAVEFGNGQYSFTTYFANGAAGNLVSEGEYLGILLYGSDDEYAVRVFSATSDGVTWAADDSATRSAGTAGAWAAAVPEPTSGLLLLLGLAGLALKRGKGALRDR